MAGGWRWRSILRCDRPSHLAVTRRGTSIWAMTSRKNDIWTLQMLCPPGLTAKVATSAASYPEGFPFSGKKNPARMSWESIESGCIYLLRCSVVFDRDPEGFPFLGKKNPARMSWESKNQGASTITTSGTIAPPSGRFPDFSTKKIQPV